MSKNQSFVVGATIKFSAEFRVDGSLTTPSTIALLVEEPDGTDQTPSNSASATGKYSGTFQPTQVGYHHWRWTSTGTAAGVKEGTIYVNSSAIS